VVKKILAAAVLLGVLAAAFVAYSPSGPAVSGVTAGDTATSIARAVEHENGGALLYASASQVEEGSNAWVVDYVIVLTHDPELFTGQPTTQAELAEMEAALSSLQGSIADTLKYTSRYLLPRNPSVVAVRITVLFRNGQALVGGAMAEQLKALPQDSEDDAVWLSAVALQPGAAAPLPSGG
jgi:hypothetical protein